MSLMVPLQGASGQLCRAGGGLLIELKLQPVPEQGSRSHPPRGGGGGQGLDLLGQEPDP